MRTRRQLFATGAALAVVIGVAGCGDDDGATESPATDGETAAVTTEAEASSETTAAEEPATTDGPETTEEPATTDTGAETEGGTVEVANDDTHGEYLVDADGLTLYVFTQDEGTTSACTSDECMDAWPPIAADDPVAGEGVDESELGTADALAPNQVTYHGQLLYYFVGDQAPGDITGTDIDDWYPVDPDGNAIGLEDGEVDDGGTSNEGGY